MGQREAQGLVILGERSSRTGYTGRENLKDQLYWETEVQGLVILGERGSGTGYTGELSLSLKD